MVSSAVDDLNATFDACGAFVRDTTMSDALVERYIPGLLLREPTFCDASARLGGFVAPHRCLIFSSDARSLPYFEPASSWGLCLWLPNRRLKVIDKVTADGLTQFTLLEIPERLLPWFAANEPNQIEETFAAHGRELFGQFRNAAPVPELDSDAWRQRLTFPVGVDDQGRPFALYTAEEHASDEVRPRIAQVLPYLARLHCSAGAYGEAESVLHSAVVAQRPFADRDPNSPALLLLKLGELRLEFGNTRAAENDLLEAFGLFKRLEEERIPVARTLLLLGHAYNHGGEPWAAERHYLHALKIARRVTGDRSALVAVLVQSLGALYETWGRYDEASANLDEAMAIERELYGSEQPTTLNNVARLQQARGEPDAALATYERIRANLTSAQSSLDEITLNANIAELMAGRGELDESFARLVAVVGAERRVIDDFAALVPERAQLELARSRRVRIDQCLSLALSAGGDQRRRAREATELVLARKGLAADLVARRRHDIIASHRPEAREGIDQLAALRSRIAVRRVAGPVDEPVSAFDEALRDDELRREELERKLANMVAELAMEYVNHHSSIARAIAESAPVDSVVIEYFRFSRFNFDAVRARGEHAWDAARYLALVLSPKRPGEPELVDLAEAGLVDGLVADVRRAITGGPDVRAHETRDMLRPAPAPLAGDSTAGGRLRAAIVDPLLPYLGDARRLLLAPDGDLLRLPFDALPSPDGRVLADHFTISYLSTARDVLQWSSTPEPTTGVPLVLADPAYDAGEERDAPAGRPFRRLPGTRAEGQRVAAAVAANLRLGQHATKSALFACEIPSMLHIATHGFVLQERREVLEPEDMKPGVTVRPTDGDRALLALDGILVTPTQFEVANDEPFTRMSGHGLSNPLLRSGLALAGANTWLRGSDPPDDAGNGILTAEEVVGMDLTGTALVVLSACETGLGEIESGEGTFGLRRAFLLAGARTLVISLWKVPDDETADLMEAFYQRLLAGRPRAEALHEAQAAMRAKHPEPFYWAAFICVGDISPLTGVTPAARVPAARH
jgi:CHAT domain-containing protein/tetratricopeptide (TPR) repeat protein